MLLATDLDGTFLAGNADQRHQLYQLISLNPDIELVFVTGRGLEHVIPLLSDPTIPKPKYVICDVGATIVDGDTLQPVQPLQNDIEQSWPGEVQVQVAMESFDNIIRQDQPQERRCSFYCKQDAIPDNIDQIAEQLGCDYLYSSGRYLDFLPHGVNKGSTLKSLVDFLEIDHESVLVAGDTLNDVSLFQQDFLGVCVSNAEQGLLDKTSDVANVYHAEASGCGGILEAITYFNFLSSKAIDAETQLQYKPGESELVIVYHRLPFEEYLENDTVKERAPKSPNGIIPTLLSFFGDGKKGSWIAWSTFSDENKGFSARSSVDNELYPNLTASKVSLSKSEVDIFYKQFSKEAFWPTLHTFWQEATFREDHWTVFQKVNRKFAEQAAKEAAEGATVWIHDYNLWMVPAFLREMRPDLTIAFFHHTYFPSADVFNVLPWRRDIVGSLLQCDFVGFHIPRQSENFMDVVQGVAPVKVLERANCAPRFLTYGCAVGVEEMTTKIEVHGREIQLGALPVGLDLGRIERALEKKEVQSKRTQLLEDLKDTRVILSVERLDYTKGILPKLEAYELLLARHPELIGEITLLTICVPAAKEMTIYQDLQTQIEQTVGRINGRFARVGWTPVQFFFRSFPFEDLVAYYSMADIMWITPLRDGLNLVVKEYVATQGLTDGNGVVVLSEFAGAAAELRGALLTNPHDPHDLVSTCFQALSMDEQEAHSRMREAFDVVKCYDINAWGREFFDTIESLQTNDVISLEKAKAAVA